MKGAFRYSVVGSFKVECLLLDIEGSVVSSTSIVRSLTLQHITSKSKGISDKWYYELNVVFAEHPSLVAYLERIYRRKQD